MNANERQKHQKSAKVTLAALVAFAAKGQVSVLAFWLLVRKLQILRKKCLLYKPVLSLRNWQSTLRYPAMYGQKRSAQNCAPFQQNHNILCKKRTIAFLSSHHFHGCTTHKTFHILVCFNGISSEPVSVCACFNLSEHAQMTSSKFPCSFLSRKNDRVQVRMHQQQKEKSLVKKCFLSALKLTKRLHSSHKVVQIGRAHV